MRTPQQARHGQRQHNEQMRSYQKQAQKLQENLKDRFGTIEKTTYKSPKCEEEAGTTEVPQCPKLTYNGGISVKIRTGKYPPVRGECSECGETFFDDD